jgi:hypothetical protein
MNGTSFNETVNETVYAIVVSQYHPLSQRHKL